jgi:lysophospholipase L1-like esterase
VTTGKPSFVTTTKAAPVSTAKPSSAPAPTAGYRFLGRVNPTTKELTWPGTGVSFTFTGTSATISLANIVDDNSFDLVVDGGASTVIGKVSNTTISTPKLAKGTHTVVLRRRSETALGTVSINTVTTDGTFVSEKALTRQIEVIGDSITVGYGLDGTNPCTNNALVTDNPKTYGVLAATALGADYNVIAWSGKGLVRNIATGSPDTSPLIPELYTRYGANDASGSYPFPSTWKPQAVVINLGTNDFSYLGYDANGQSYAARAVLNASDFTAGLVNFVKSLQTHYPDAEFFLLNSPMLSDTFPTAKDVQKSTQTKAIQDAVTKLGKKAHFVDWPTQGSDVGCDYHPNAATHAAEGKVLAAAISKVLGW